MLEFAPHTPPWIRDYLGYRSAIDAVLDPRGRWVRFTPWRRTAMHTVLDGANSEQRLFCKLRRRGHRAARREWRALTELPRCGLRVPVGLFFARQGGDSVVGLGAVPGRSMDALLLEEGGAAGEAVELALGSVPFQLRRLHDCGWVFRDTYWNHLFAADGQVHWIDVERAFRPVRWRRRRWIVKDLAGLLASLPAGAGLRRTDALRFLLRYLGPRREGWKRLAAAVVRKAGAIVRHVPRHP